MSFFFRPWLSVDENSEQSVIYDCSNPGPSSPRTPTKKKEVVIGRGAKLRKQSVKIVQHVRNYLRSVIEKGGVLSSKNINKLTADATGIGICTVKKISSIDNVDNYHTPTKKQIERTKLPFDKIDDFSRDLLRRTVYEFYQNGLSPSVTLLTETMKKKTEGTDYPFPYGSKTVSRLLSSMGFKYCSLKKKPGRAESNDVISWRYRYLNEINILRAQGYNDIYLDETWYDSNSCRMKNWSDDTDNCIISTPDNKGNRIVIIHCGGRSGFVDGALFVTHKKMSDAPADYHGTMTAEIFEDWFENKILRCLEEPSVIVLDNASYHSRILNPVPTVSWRKDAILMYMQKQNIPIPHPVPIIPILIDIIRENLPVHERKKKYVIDEMAYSYGHLVLRLPPYHCILNPIEMVWSQIKRKVASQNLKKRQVNEIIDFLRDACNNVSPQQWKNYINHIETVENSYRNIESVFDSGMRICVNDSSDSSEESDQD